MSVVEGYITIESYIVYKEGFMYIAVSQLFQNNVVD